MKLRSSCRAAGITLIEVLALILVVVVVLVAYSLSTSQKGDARTTPRFANEQERLEYEHKVRVATQRRQAHEAEVARLLKKETATCRATFSAPGRKGYSIAFSPDGSKIAAIYKYGLFSSRNQLYVWEVKSGKQLFKELMDDYSVRTDAGDAVISSSYRTIAFSPDGSLLAHFCIQGDDQRFIRIMNIAAQKQEGALIPYSNSASTDERGEMLRFSPDGSQLVSVTYSRDREEPFAIHRWDVASRRPCAEPVVMKERVYTIDYTQDGEHFLLTTKNKASIVHIAEGKVTRSVNSDERIFFNRNGSKVAMWESDSSAGEVRILNLEDAPEPLIAPMRIETAKVLEFSPDGSMIATAKEHESVYFEKQPYVLLLRDSTTGELIGKPMRHEGCIISAVFSPDGRSLATVDTEGNTRLWDVPERQDEGEDGAKRPTASESPAQTSPASKTALTDEQLSPLASRELLQGVSFAPDGSLIATICKGTDICFWDTATHQPRTEETLAHKAQVSHAAFAPDSTLFATVADDLRVRIWDIITRKNITTIKHTHSVNAAAFSPNSRQIATASTDGNVYLWDTRSGTQCGKVMPLGGPVSTVAFSPDGNVLAATGYAAPSVRLWNAQTQKGVGELKVEGQFFQGCVVFSPDGTTIAAPVTDNSIRLWESATQKLTDKVLQHAESISALAFSPNGRLIATLAGNRLCFWDARSGEPVGSEQEYTGSFHNLVFSPDGRLLACDDQQGYIIFHKVPAEDEQE